MFAWIKRKTIGVCVVLSLIMLAGSAAAQPVPFSQNEVQSLQMAENRNQAEVEAVVAGDGNDALAAVGIFFLVLICIGAIAASNSDSQTQ